MARKDTAKVIEVTREEHEQVNEKYKLALSGVDDAIQSVRESREKVRRIFQLQVIEAGK